ncbi:hypothetical protein C8F01DRAFT_1100754 [Mycena amicta]|nr:hypothetical protein C8F01DRAFT_1100754 [Mycena amicta]
MNIKPIMSSMNDNIPTTTTTAATATPTRPEHHVHRDSEPLPGSGARGAAPTADYSAENMERLPSKVWQESETTGAAMKPSRELGDIAGDERPAMDRSNSSSGKLQSTGPSREPSSASGVTGDHVDERNPKRKVTAADKLIGKAQQVAGKVAHKPEMQEKGALRQTEGKAPVM